MSDQVSGDTGRKDFATQAAETAAGLSAIAAIIGAKGMSGDTGRTERARLRAIPGCSLIHGTPVFSAPHALAYAWECDLCLDLVLRALAPEPSGVPPERCETCGGTYLRCECCTTAGFDKPGVVGATPKEDAR